MKLEDILNEVRANLTGDPLKDAPYLNEMSAKYKGQEFSEELDREFASIMFETEQKSHQTSVDEFLEVKNQDVNEKLEKAEKRFNNRNFNAGIEILEEIIKNNIFAWHDTDDCTYKCFGTPLEYLLYKNLYEDKNNAKEIKPVNCNLSKVYWMYAHGLTKKNRYGEALKAIERAQELNPVDPELYIQYIELAKQTSDTELLKKCAEMLLKCAITKQQVGHAYFTYSFYFSEIRQFDKALALLQMSKIFRESDLYETELEYITQQMGLGHAPAMFNTNELMNILITENIQPGPSAAVVHIANTVAKQFEDEGELLFAKRFYEIVFELTEDEKTGEHIKEIAKKIK